jgi:hypothetical protein
MRSRASLARPFPIGAALVVAALVALGLLPCTAQQIHRNSFETAQTQWVKGNADAAYDEQAHGMTDQGAHDLQRSEYVRVNARQGSHIYYQYATPKAPINDELNISLWVKSNRPGVQLLARVVLPNEADPGSLQDRRTTLIRGDIYRGPPGRWKRLELGRAVNLLRQQQQMMQAQLKRAVNVTDAYIDALLVNVYGGPGVSEVWIDGLEMGPVLEPPPGQLTSRPSGPAMLGQAAPARPAPLVEFNGTHLTVDGRRLFFRGIRHTDTPMEVLREAGFNTIFCEADVDPQAVRQAANLGFWLVPHLPVTSDDTHLTSADGLGRVVQRFPVPENVLFWNMGNALSHEQTTRVGNSAQFVHRLDPQRPLGGDAWDGQARYSLSLNLVGVHRWPLMTSLEINQYRQWLEQRRALANPGTFLWSWIQTHTPEWYTNLLYERPSADGFTEPIGPQAEQIRLLTYTALGVGCRGLGFWSDRFLADSHQGRDRLLGVALLNQELEMLEPVLLDADNNDPPKWIATSCPDVQAAVLHGRRSILVLPMWTGAGSQYVPGQAAAGKLWVVVPQVPQSMQAWDVSPGDVRALRPERVPGGMKITLPEFGLTAAVVFTSEPKLIVDFQTRCQARRQLAAQWSYDMAVRELDKVARVHEELAGRGLTVVDAGKLLNDARARLARAKDAWDNRLFSEAYHEAQRALRPARILMRALWDKTTRDLDVPVASPYAVSFFTLGKHVQFMEQLKRCTPAANALPDGDFEVVPGRPQGAWVPQDVALDEVDLVAERVTEIPIKPPKKDPKAKQTQTSKYPAAGLKDVKKDEPPPPPVKPVEGRLCLKLAIKPKAKGVPPPRVLERSFLAINSPVVRLPPGSLVRLSACVFIPEPIKASQDGALLYDSAGGEPLAVRLTEPTPWKKITLYRRVPASGAISLTLALTGLGAVYFDDVRIEPMIWGPSPPPAPDGGVRLSAAR